MIEAEKEGWKVSKCRYCGMPIVWAERSDKPGTIPLDPKAPVFRTWLTKDHYHEAERVKFIDGDDPDSNTLLPHRYFVSHFATCPTLQRASKDIVKIRQVLKRGGNLQEIRSIVGSE